VTLSLANDNDSLVPYSRSFGLVLALAERSGDAIDDDSHFTREEQLEFFFSFQPAKTIISGDSGVRPNRSSWVVLPDQESLEYWGYIGEKQLWGARDWGSRSCPAVEAKAADLHPPPLDLKVSEHNERAISLYNKAGFRLPQWTTDIGARSQGYEYKHRETSR